MGKVWGVKWMWMMRLCRDGENWIEMGCEELNELENDLI